MTAIVVLMEFCTHACFFLETEPECLSLSPVKRRTDQPLHKRTVNPTKPGVQFRPSAAPNAVHLYTFFFLWKISNVHLLVLYLIYSTKPLEVENKNTYQRSKTRHKQANTRQNLIHTQTGTPSKAIYVHLHDNNVSVATGLPFHVMMMSSSVFSDVITAGPPPSD